MAFPGSTDEVKRRLHEAIQPVLPAWHVTVDGDVSPAAAYCLKGSRGVYESNVLLYTVETWQIHVFQRNFDPTMVDALFASLAAAGFGVRRGAQSMDGIDYVTEITATMRNTGG